jgi:type IV pilus assembly protein PilZ
MNSFMAPLLDQTTAQVNRGTGTRITRADCTRELVQPLGLRYTRVVFAPRPCAEEFAVTESDASDRRNYPRAPIDLKVEYRRLNTFFADYTRNISRGGTFIKTQKPLDIGTEFLFKLVVPTLENPIVLRGKVQWVVQVEGSSDEDPPGMGIQFIYENETQRHEIENRVERLMIDSLGKHLYLKLVGRASAPPEN